MSFVENLKKHFDGRGYIPYREIQHIKNQNLLQKIAIRCGYLPDYNAYGKTAFYKVDHPNFKNKKPYEYL